MKGKKLRMRTPEVLITTSVALLYNLSLMTVTNATNSVDDAIKALYHAV